MEDIEYRLSASYVRESTTLLFLSCNHGAISSGEYQIGSVAS